MKEKNINLDNALLDPTQVFSTPKDVLARDDFTKEQKIMILQRWKYDAKELEIADDEGMENCENIPDIMDAVLDALHQLDASID